MQSAFFKPIDLSTPGAIENLLAFHKARFGDARMEGGGEGDGGGDGSGGEGGGLGSRAGGATSSTEKGFPEGTPLEQMTVDQREAYWKFQARKHETRAKAFDGLTPEQLADLRDKASKHEAMERELMSDKDKAVAEARDAAKAEAEASLRPRLVTAEFKAAAAGRIEADTLATLLEPLDLSKFFTAAGDVDEAKVAAWVDSVAPKEAQPHRRGPSPTGAGQRGSSSAPSLASGSEAYARRHGGSKKSA